jgi:hypothetical protein
VRRVATTGVIALAVVLGVMAYALVHDLLDAVVIVALMVAAIAALAGAL